MAVDTKTPVWDRSEPFPPGNDLGKQFEPGNKAAVKHGATSPALIEPRADELVAALYGAFPHLDTVKDSLPVKRLALVLARLERVHGWLNAKSDPIFDDPKRGRPHRVLERVERWEREATALEKHLAMPPLLRARVELTGKGKLDLAAMWAAEQAAEDDADPDGDDA